MKLKIKIFALITLTLVGCYPEKLKYKLGLGTQYINGTLTQKGGELLKSDSFIVITEYFSRFIQFENESPIYVPKSRIIFPNKKGDFHIDFDLKASSINLSFIAKGYKLHSFFFNRQIGVGNLKYDVELIKSKSWRNEFFINTRPYLEKFILEQRYDMPDYQQTFIGNWLAEVKNNLAEK